MKRVYFYLHPNDVWMAAAKYCHPVEIEGPFPVLMTEKRFREIKAWAERLPGWENGILEAKPAKEIMLEEARVMYMTGKFSKTQVAAKFPLHRETVMKVLRDVDSNAA